MASRGVEVLDVEPPPPDIGWKVPVHRRQWRGKQNLLDVVKGKNCVFTPCVYTQNTLGICRRIQKMGKTWDFSVSAKLVSHL